MRGTGTSGAQFRRGAKRAAAILLLGVAWSCAHASIRKVGDCDQVPAEQRVACAACTVKNETQGRMAHGKFWIGDYEYRPDNDPSDRCVRVR